MAFCFSILTVLFWYTLSHFDIAPSVVRRKNAYFLFFLVRKSRISGALAERTPRQTDFFGAKWDFGQENPVQRRRKSSEKGSFRPKTGWIGRKRVVLGGKSQGGDRAEKRTLLPILPCYEVAKWVQMNFSLIFFSAKSCRECRNALPLHSQSGSNALARESYAPKARRQRKRCCDLWKSYITDCREVQGTIDHEALFLSGKKLLRVKWIVPSNSTPKQNKGYRNLSDKNRKQTNIIFTMKSLILAQDER